MAFALPPLKGEGGLPKAVRGGVTATPRLLRRCHPLPARLRGPTSPLQGEVKTDWEVSNDNP